MTIIKSIKENVYIKTIFLPLLETILYFLIFSIMLYETRFFLSLNEIIVYHIFLFLGIAYLVFHNTIISKRFLKYLLFFIGLKMIYILYIITQKPEYNSIDNHYLSFLYKSHNIDEIKIDKYLVSKNLVVVLDDFENKYYYEINGDLIFESHGNLIVSTLMKENKSINDYQILKINYLKVNNLRPYSLNDDSNNYIDDNFFEFKGKRYLLNDLLEKINNNNKRFLLNRSYTSNDTELNFKKIRVLIKKYDNLTISTGFPNLGQYNVPKDFFEKFNKVNPINRVVIGCGDEIYGELKSAKLWNVECCESLSSSEMTLLSGYKEILKY